MPASFFTDTDLCRKTDLFNKTDLFSENEPFFPVSDEQYQQNYSYAQTQLAQYHKRLSQACSSRVASKMKKDFSQYCTIEFMESLGESWKSLFDCLSQIYCYSCICNQLRFSRLTDRAKFTRAAFEEKLLICGLTDPQYSEFLQRDLERAGVTA